MLEVEGINARYGDSQVLWDVSLSVGDGEVVGLLGRNGAGKTTTLSAIAGVQPPSTGTVTFDGEDITGQSVSAISRQGIKLVPEDRRPFDGLTVRENLELSTDTTNGEDWDVPRALGEFTQLNERANQRAGDLSGGEQQMLVIAMALVGNPKLVLLDEPMEGLAPQIVDQIVDIVRRVREADIPVLLVEQNVDVCLELIDRGYLLHKGEIRMSGSAAELADATEEIDRYLGIRV